MTIPAQMTAVRITAHGGPEVLEVVEVPVPAPEPGEVLVEVRAVALNNTDLWTRQGAYGTPEAPDALAGWRGPIDFPRTQGADVATPHVHDVTSSPLSDAQLAALPTAYGTALGMIERGSVHDGDTVLVTGASGGVGLALVQLARARGARVLAVSSGNKLEAVRRAGAHEVLDRAGDVVEQARATSAGSVDVVLDVVAGELVGAGLSLLREGGRWVVAGALGGHAVAFDVRRLYLHNAQVIGSSMHTRAHFALLMDVARRGQVHPVIARTYPLAEAARAQEELRRRRHVGKIVLDPALNPRPAAPAPGRSPAPRRRSASSPA